MATGSIRKRAMASSSPPVAAVETYSSIFQRSSVPASVHSMKVSTLNSRLKITEESPPRSISRSNDRLGRIEEPADLPPGGLRRPVFQRCCT